MPVQQSPRKVAAYQAMFSDPTANAKRDEDAAREHEVTAQRGVEVLRKVTAKAAGAELDDAALTALAGEIARMLGFRIDQTVPAANHPRDASGLLASLAGS
jgi:Flp pilus assembly CpaF family ATPase